MRKYSCAVTSKGTVTKSFQCFKTRTFG